MPSPSQADTAPAGRSRKFKRRARFRRTATFIALLLTAAATIPTLLWWQERPLRQAEALLNSKQPDAPQQALRIVDDWLKLHSGNSAAIALRARILVRLGQPAETLRLLQQVGADRIEEMQAWTEACLLLERWTSALPVLEYLAKLQPDNPDTLHQLAACRAKLGRYDDAVAAARDFAKLRDCHARGYTLIGMLERDRANYQKCVEAWDELLRKHPDATGLQVTPAELFLEYGKALLQLGRSKDAAAALQKSTSLQVSADASAYLGKALASSGQAAAAETAWKDAVQLNPDSRIAREGLAELAMQQSRFEQALNWLTPLANSPNLTSSTAFLLQRVHTLLKQPAEAAIWKERINLLKRKEDARIQMEQVIFTSPDSLWGQVFQAWFLAEQKNPDQAKTLLAKFVDEDSHPFIVKLWSALQNGAPPPGLEEVPMQTF
jgi:tetratricopeptide (TPR) repeat protein